MTINEIKDTYGQKTFERMFDALLDSSVHVLVTEVLNRLTDAEVHAWAMKIAKRDEEESI